jgi:cell wall-associated NlpC family hydrolase
MFAVARVRPIYVAVAAVLALVIFALVSGARPAEAQAADGGSVVAQAESYLGVPYVYGGGSYSGVDCSGLTSAVYADLGVSLPHSAAGQYAATVPVSSPQPGDLVFSDFTGGGVGHVAIYAGGGMVISASLPGTTVRYEPLAYDYVVGYGRV